MITSSHLVQYYLQNNDNLLILPRCLGFHKKIKLLGTDQIISVFQKRKLWTTDNKHRQMLIMPWSMLSTQARQSCRWIESVYIISPFKGLRDLLNTSLIAAWTGLNFSRKKVIPYIRWTGSEKKKKLHPSLFMLLQGDWYLNSTR